MGHGPLRFGETEGAQWTSSRVRSVLGPAIHGASVAVGAAPGYFTAIHSNASAVDSLPSTDAVQSIPPGTTWQDRIRLSATGGDDLRVDGVDVALSAAAAGPAYHPNDTAEELGCMLEQTHRWFNASTAGGDRLVSNSGCTPMQRAVWMASGVPASMVQLIAVNVPSSNMQERALQNSTIDSELWPWESSAGSSRGLRARHNESTDLLVDAAIGARSEWALAALGESQSYLGGEPCSAASYGMQWRQRDYRNVVASDNSTGVPPQSVRVAGTNGSDYLVHPAALMIRTPPLLAVTQTGKRASVRQSRLNTERQIRMAFDRGSASRLGDPIAGVGFLMAAANSWRLHVPAGSTRFAVEPFALGQLAQQRDAPQPYEGGGSVQLRGSGAVALLGLGVGEIVHQAAHYQRFLPSSNSSAMWPVLPEHVPAVRTKIRSGTMHSSATLDDSKALAVGSTVLSQAGSGPAIGSTAELEIPLVALSESVSRGLTEAEAAWDGSEAIDGAQVLHGILGPPDMPQESRQSNAARYVQEFLRTQEPAASPRPGPGPAPAIGAINAANLGFRLADGASDARKVKVVF